MLLVAARMIITRTGHQIAGEENGMTTEALRRGWATHTLLKKSEVRYGAPEVLEWRAIITDKGAIYKIRSGMGPTHMERKTLLLRSGLLIRRRGPVNLVDRIRRRRLCQARSVLRAVRSVL